MSETLQPISERTDESLVRTIAEWMRWNIGHCPPHMLKWVLAENGYDHSREYQLGFRTGDSVGNLTPYVLFGPHLLGPNGSSDRERVMLATSSNVSLTPFDFGDGTYSWVVEERRVENPRFWEPNEFPSSLGRAFCEAVVSWIEAQESAK